MMGEVLSNSTPHQVVVASPFQLGWKAVAVKSKQLPHGLQGGPPVAGHVTFAVGKGAAELVVVLALVIDAVV